MFPFWAFEHKWLDLSAIVWVWISSQMRTAIIDNHSSCARSDGGDDRAWKYDIRLYGGKYLPTTLDSFDLALILTIELKREVETRRFILPPTEACARIRAPIPNVRITSLILKVLSMSFDWQPSCLSESG